eukprot:3615887-Pleurochrysis_carterae.AAC.1
MSAHLLGWLRAESVRARVGRDADPIDAAVAVDRHHRRRHHLALCATRGSGKAQCSLDMSRGLTECALVCGSGQSAGGRGVAGTCAAWDERRLLCKGEKRTRRLVGR